MKGIWGIYQKEEANMDLKISLVDNNDKSLVKISFSLNKQIPYLYLNCTGNWFGISLFFIYYYGSIEYRFQNVFDM